jgi:hypothetical protein
VIVGGEGSDAVVPGRLAGVVGEDQECGERHGSGGGDEEIVEEGRQPEGHGGGWIRRWRGDGPEKEHGFRRQGFARWLLGRRGDPPGFGEGGGGRGGRWDDWLCGDIG